MTTKKLEDEMQKNRPPGKRKVGRVDDGGLLKRNLDYHLKECLSTEKQFEQVVEDMQGRVTITASEVIAMLKQWNQDGKVKCYSRGTPSVVVFRLS